MNYKMTEHSINSALLNNSNLDLLDVLNISMCPFGENCSYTYGACDLPPFAPYIDWTQINAVTVTIIILYILVMIFAVFGNILVIWTIWRNTHMHTVTNYYIVNLALSDFLVSSIVLPLKLLEYTTPCSWQIFSHDGLCAVVSYILPIFVFASVLTLVAISLERYYAIVHPLSAMKINSKSRTKKIIAATWAIPIIICSPYLYCGSITYSVQSSYGTVSRQICTDRFDEIDGGTGTFRRIYFLLLSAVMYFLPMIVIITTCSRIAQSLLQPIIIETSQSGARNCKRRDIVNKRKVARMVIVIAVAFIVSWSPMYIVNMVTQVQSPTDSFLNRSNFFFTMLTIHLAGFINSCVNPFIYTAMSKKFRKSFSRTLGKIFCNYYCRQRLFHYRDSMIQRGSTAYTTASHGSFVDPEAEPLQNELKEASRARSKESHSHSSSSDGDSSCRSQNKVCKTTKGRQPVSQDDSVCVPAEAQTLEVKCDEPNQNIDNMEQLYSVKTQLVPQREVTNHEKLITNGFVKSAGADIENFLVGSKNGIKTETFIMNDMNATDHGEDGHVRKLIMCISDTNDVESIGSEIKQDTCRFNGV